MFARRKLRTTSAASPSSALPKTANDVGELTKYRDADVQIRGLVQPMHGRAGMVLSHARQFYGGPPKFRPNPLLARGFSAEQSGRRSAIPICARRAATAPS